MDFSLSMLLHQVLLEEALDRIFSPSFRDGDDAAHVMSVALQPLHL